VKLREVRAAFLAALLVLGLVSTLSLLNVHATTGAFGGARGGGIMVRKHVRERSV
jgi:hypothetical protein